MPQWPAVIPVCWWAGKVATGWWAARRQGLGIPARVRAGTALIAHGEFSIVIAGLAIGTTVDPDVVPLAE